MIRTIMIGAAGRMGRSIVQQIAENSNFSLSGAVEDKDSPHIGIDAGRVAGCESQGIEVTSDLPALLNNADAVIDFSAPETTFLNAEAAVEAGCGVVIGTTGMSGEDTEKIKHLADKGGRIVLAPNMCVGVNLLFYLCDKVARILGDDYNKEVMEMHHNQKKDSPSGTAKKIGEILADASGVDYSEQVRHGRQGAVGARTSAEIGMHAIRGGDIVGEHTAMFAGPGERVELTHKASSRATFAQGALRAAEFVCSTVPGLYDMQYVLGMR